MTDLSKLSPPALKAAMTTGADGWGQWGNIFEHVLFVAPVTYPIRKRRMCRCGCRKKVTHNVMANGVGMHSGCEMDARRFAKNPRDYIYQKYIKRRGVP